MRHRPALVLAIFLLLFPVFSPTASPQQEKKVAVSDLLHELVARSALAEPGAQPFFLRAQVLDQNQAEWEFNAVVEIYWVSPTKWRRTIDSRGFSQTLVMNGDRHFEQDKGDYFPPAVERVIRSLVDPVPANVLQTFEKLNLMIDPPDGHPGQCLADDNFTDDQGERSRATVALNCQTGLLNYLWFPGWSIGKFADYRPFHGKTVAWRTEDTDYPVTAQIEALRDLDHPDEMLFAVDATTPASGQIRTVLVNGSEFMKQLVISPELHWPTVSNLPDHGTINMDIVTDRNGRVREAHSFLASNKELREWTAAQVMNWQFKPYLLDGVPVQVAATFDIDFKTSLAPGASSISALDYFEKSRGLSTFRLPDAHPFHLQASFIASGNAELTGKGTYDEIWISQNQWRREAVLAGHTITETRNGDLFYRQIDQAYAPRRIDDAIDVLTLAFLARNSYQPEWHVSDGKLDQIPMREVWTGQAAVDGQPDSQAEVYFFEPSEGLLRGHRKRSILTIYNDFQEFSGKQIARKLLIAQDGAKILEINIDQLESAAPPQADIFTLAGVRPLSLAANAHPTSKMVQAVPVIKIDPVFPPGFHALNVHGKVVCRVTVDNHGHPRLAMVPDGINPLLANAIRSAALQWEFIPATFNGFPSESQSALEFDY